MRVTFDTNVWNRMVFPDDWCAEPNFPALKALREAVRTYVLEGLICESFATSEAIQKRSRAKYYVESVPSVTVTTKVHGPGAIGMQLNIGAKHEQHPGLGSHFERELTEALAIGMKLLSTPYIGLAIPPRLRDHPEIYLNEVFATSEYNERFGAAATTIAAKGIGEGALAKLTANLVAQLDGPRPAGMSDRVLIYGVYEYALSSGQKTLQRQIEGAFSEAADGDLVAAHVASGAQYLCTEDRGRSAMAASIFDQEHRTWLTATFGVKIVDAEELVELVSSFNSGRTQSAP